MSIQYDLCDLDNKGFRWSGFWNKDLATRISDQTTTEISYRIWILRNWTRWWCSTSWHWRRGEHCRLTVGRQEWHEWGRVRRWLVFRIRCPVNDNVKYTYLHAMIFVQFRIATLALEEESVLWLSNIINYKAHRISISSFRVSAVHQDLPRLIPVAFVPYF